METGQQGDYRWIEGDIGLETMLACCPEIVLKRFVAVTAFDSGPFIPTPDEKKLGWREEGGIAWSPEIYSTELLPYEDYDEWYIFRSPVAFKPTEIFVNREIKLHDPGCLLENMDPTWDRVAALTKVDQLREIQERFWFQIISIQPESYLCRNSTLLFVTRDFELFGRVAALLKE